MRGEVRAGRREAVGVWWATAAQAGRARMQIMGRPLALAHLEHGGHRCNARDIEVQRLVECLCVLPRRNDTRCELEDGRTVGDGSASSVHGRDRLQIGGTGHARSVPRTCSSCQ